VVCCVPGVAAHPTQLSIGVPRIGGALLLLPVGMWDVVAPVARAVRDICWKGQDGGNVMQGESRSHRCMQLSEGGGPVVPGWAWLAGLGQRGPRSAGGGRSPAHCHYASEAQVAACLLYSVAVSQMHPLQFGCSWSGACCDPVAGATCSRRARGRQAKLCRCQGTPRLTFSHLSNSQVVRALPALVTVQAAAALAFSVSVCGVGYF